MFRSVRHFWFIFMCYNLTELVNVSFFFLFKKKIIKKERTENGKTLVLFVVVGGG